MDKICEIDFSRILVEEEATREDWLKVAAEVNDACAGLGFLHIFNHGIPTQIIERAFGEATKYFALPQSQKDAFKIVAKNEFGGYSQIGQQLLNPASPTELRESFAIVGLGSTQEFPENLPDMRSSFFALFKECSQLTRKLLKVFAIALGMPNEDYFVNSSIGLFDPSIQNQTTLRFQRYPPISDFSEIPKGAVRCGTHTDFGVCTLLFQDMIGGLEVQNTQGQWIPATPVQNAILVNLGDFMEMWTKGRFRATPHRVLVPEEELLRRTSRMSLAFFVSTDDNYVVSPLKSNTYYNFGQNFRAMTAKQFWDKRLEATY